MKRRRDIRLVEGLRKKGRNERSWVQSLLLIKKTNKLTINTYRKQMKRRTQSLFTAFSFSKLSTTNYYFKSSTAS